jgi:hypothetical protein
MFQLHEINTQVPVEPEWQWLVYWTDTQTSLGAYIRFGRSQHRLIEIFCDHMKCIFIAKFMCRSLNFFLQHSRSKASSWLGLLNPSTEYDLLDSQSTSGRSQRKLIEIFCDHMKCIFIAEFVCQSLNFFLQCSKSNAPSWLGLNPSTEHDLLDGKSTLRGGCQGWAQCSPSKKQSHDHVTFRGSSKMRFNMVTFAQFQVIHATNLLILTSAKRY